jgi:hypothetical protein
VNPEEIAIKALHEIRMKYGQVCDNYEICNCRSCEGSYGAWATADKALKEISRHNAIAKYTVGSAEDDAKWTPWGDSK